MRPSWGLRLSPMSMPDATLMRATTARCRPAGNHVERVEVAVDADADPQPRRAVVRCERHSRAARIASSIRWSTSLTTASSPTSVAQLLGCRRSALSISDLSRRWIRPSMPEAPLLDALEGPAIGDPGSSARPRPAGLGDFLDLVDGDHVRTDSAARPRACRPVPRRRRRRGAAAPGRPAGGGAAGGRACARRASGRSARASPPTCGRLVSIVIMPVGNEAFDRLALRSLDRPP